MPPQYMLDTNVVSSLVTDPAGEVAAQVASLDRREFVRA